MPKAAARVAVPQLLVSSWALALGACSLEVGGSGWAGWESSGTVVRSDHVSQEPVHVSARSGPPTCTGREAAATFTQALCVCGDLDLAGSLATSSVDASGATFASGGAVGVNGDLDVAGAIEVGSLAVARDVGLAGSADIHGDARVDGDLALAGTWRVDRDAWIAGSVDAATGEAGFVIERDLYQPVGAGRDEVVVGGAVIEAPFELPAPCPCDEGQLVPVAAIVAEAARDNDDAVRGVDPSALAGVIGSAVAELPSGRVYFDEISGAGDVTLYARGRTAVFVGGDVSMAGSFAIELAPGAELDLYVGGDLDVAGSITLGDEARPSAARLWVARGIDLAGSAFLAGDVYAPHASLSAAGDVEIVGAAFFGTVDLAGSLTVRYDRAVLDAGDACDLPEPTSCGSHLDCAGGEACVQGACGACATDADCGCGMVCSAGACDALLL